MPFASHHQAEARNFDCLYDPNYILPSEQEARKAASYATARATPMQVLLNYDAMFESAPKKARQLYRRQPLLPPISNATSAESMEIASGVRRLQGGANNPAERRVYNVVTSPSECKKQAPGLGYVRPNTDAKVITVRLSESQSKPEALRYAECKYFADQPKGKRIKTRATQTLYRESSAQTLPYLPGVSNPPDVLETLEIFQLPTILPGDGAPGLYEVEVLERARKRWALNKALKDNFRRQLEAAREQAKMPQHKTILEAFEWERWIEREEYIQECQMMRLELVIRMFDKREREMHEASKTRIERCCEQIAARRAAGLRKNEIEYDRQIRRLEMKRLKIPRNWRKETISNELGNPRCEFYAPQMRYGVNPSRRHFTSDRKAFEARMDDLEKRAVNMTKLVCPFAKLKKWSKPKGRFTEVEQNFCSDENLKKLYEGLKGLRDQSEKHKIMPKCLIEKEWKDTREGTAVNTNVIHIPAENCKWDFHETNYEDEHRRWSHEYDRLKFMRVIADEKQVERLRQEKLTNEMRDEELESLIVSYEGTTIGWLLRFLHEEMGRLQEQRKLHFITMLAQKERWRREAIEAGLRQKENDMREIFEQLFQESFTANTEICTEYLDNILDVDTRAYADDGAETNAIELARLIDSDILRWLSSFLDIQNPLNFETLRHTLNNLIFPDLKLLRLQYEAKKVVHHVVEKVLFPNVYKLLEPYDISFSVAEDTVDRLIDTDLNYFSGDETSDCDCELDNCTCNAARREAKAIMRKLIRYGVPGRRWRTSTERVAFENVNDIIEDAFVEAQRRESKNKVDETRRLSKNDSHLNLLTSKSNISPLSTSSSSSLKPVTTQTFDIMEGSKDITRQLKHEEHIDITDPDLLPPDTEIMNHYEYELQQDPEWATFRQLGTLKTIPSTFDIISLGGDLTLNTATKQDTSSEYSLIGQIFGGTCAQQEVKETRRFIHYLINQAAKSFIPPEEGDSQDASFHSEDVSTIKEEEKSNLYSWQSVVDYTGCFSQTKQQEMPHGADDDEPVNCETEDTDAGEHECDDESVSEEFVLEINESELDKMNGSDCKCTQEIEHEAYVKELLNKGKVKIIRKPKTDEDSSLSATSIKTFEYNESRNTETAIALQVQGLAQEPEVTAEVEVELAVAVETASYHETNINPEEAVSDTNVQLAEKKSSSAEMQEETEVSHVVSNADVDLVEKKSSTAAAQEVMQETEQQPAVDTTAAEVEVEAGTEEGTTAVVAVETASSNEVDIKPAEALSSAEVHEETEVSVVVVETASEASTQPTEAAKPEHISVVLPEEGKPSTSAE